MYTYQNSYYSFSFYFITSRIMLTVLTLIFIPVTSPLSDYSYLSGTTSSQDPQDLPKTPPWSICMPFIFLNLTENKKSDTSSTLYMIKFNTRTAKVGKFTFFDFWIVSLEVLHMKDSYSMTFPNLAVHTIWWFFFTHHITWPGHAKST